MSAGFRVITVGTNRDDCHALLRIDRSKMTDEVAREIVGFLAHPEMLMHIAEGDLIRAVAMLAAPILLTESINGSTLDAAAETLGCTEGWPSDHGIVFDGAETPLMQAECMEVYSDETEESES